MKPQTSPLLIASALVAAVALSVAAAVVVTRAETAQAEPGGIIPTKAAVVKIPQSAGDADDARPATVTGRAAKTFTPNGGGVGMMVDPSFDCVIVATKTPDGKLEMDCVAAKAATAMVNSQAPPREERLPVEK
jgi:hypothetical protein